MPAAETFSLAIALAMAYVPVITLVLARGRLGRLNAAAGLVTFGALFIATEHWGFATSESKAIAFLPGVGVHMRYHFYMAGVYALVAAVLISLVGWTLLREGRREGWFAILFALIIGGGFEITGAAGTLFHGFPPSWALGLVIYAYPLAWASALVLSYHPIFKFSKPDNMKSYSSPV
ncbi:MAG: hypothetical protein R3335_03050 [Anaerolineales bacterium]|nr:hypothetical protein [Anaerolineales bacterium]